MSTAPLVFERTYNAPAGKVWAAITQKEQMKQWYFDLKEFMPEPGFEFSFLSGPPDGIQYLHLCGILEVIPGKKLSQSWRYNGYEGYTTVTWELFDEGDKTTVKLTHAGLHTFPATNPDFAANNFKEGWTHILGTSLKDYLEK